MKPGSYYTDFVARVLAALEPGYSVRADEWIDGPDGRRDMDVEVRGMKDGRHHFCLVECKDWGRRVGVGVVDALESKRLDLSADRSIIYSNSGFTRQALRKARRVGIELATALCKHDPKIRPRLETRFIAREYYPTDHVVRLMVVGDQRPPLLFDSAEIYFEDLPVLNWVCELADLIIRPAIRSRDSAPSVEVQFVFDTHRIFVVKDVPVTVAGFHVKLRYGTRMVFQDIPITLSLGAYDVTADKILVPPKESIEWTFNNQQWQPLPMDDPSTGNPTDGALSLQMDLVVAFPKHIRPGVPRLDELIEECSLISRVPIDNGGV